MGATKKMCTFLFKLKDCAKSNFRKYPNNSNDKQTEILAVIILRNPTKILTEWGTFNDFKSLASSDMGTNVPSKFLKLLQKIPHHLWPKWLNSATNCQQFLKFAKKIFQVPDSDNQSLDSYRWVKIIA